MTHGYAIIRTDYIGFRLYSMAARLNQFVVRQVQSHSKCSSVWGMLKYITPIICGEVWATSDLPLVFFSALLVVLVEVDQKKLPPKLQSKSRTSVHCSVRFHREMSTSIGIQTISEVRFLSY